MKWHQLTNVVKKLKIRTKLILLMLAVAYTAVMLVGLISYTVGRNIIDEQINQVLSVQTTSTLESVNKLMFDRFNDMQLLISDSTLQDESASLEDKTGVLKNSLTNLGWYEQLHLTDQTGTVVVSTLKSAINKSIETFDWYQTTQQNFINVSDVVTSPFLDKEMIIYSDAVQNIDNQIIGTIIAEFPLSIIGDLLKKTPNNIEAYLTTKTDQVIAYKGPEKIESIDKEGYFIYSPGYLRQQVQSEGYFSFDGNEWKFTVQIPKVVAYAPINRYALIVLIMLILILVPIIALGTVSSRRFVKPILSLTDSVAKMRRGNLKQRTQVLSNDEVGYLAHSFNDMSSDLAEKTNNLLEEKGKYKSILESANEGIILFDRHNKAIAHNKQFGEMFLKNGKRKKLKSEDKILSFLTRENVADESKKTIDKLQKIIKEKNFKTSITAEIILKKPSYQILVVYTKPVLTEEGKLLGRIWVFNDITEEVESERSKNEFVKVASHKLRTPITTMNWNLQMLTDGSSGKLSKEQKSLLGQVEESADHLHGLSVILMSAAEIKKDKVALKKTEFTLKELIDKVGQYAQKKVSTLKKVSLKLPKKLNGIKLKADKEKVEQILTFLIENAILYSDEGKSNKIEVAVDIDKKNKKAIISVSDKGIGISDEEKAKVFTKFFRGEKAYLIHTEGTGLSLFLAKIIQNSAHQKLWFESKEGKGSTFYFTIKLA